MIRLAVFVGLTRVLSTRVQTDTDTNHATPSVAMDHICDMRAMRPNDQNLTTVADPIKTTRIAEHSSQTARSGRGVPGDVGVWPRH